MKKIIYFTLFVFGLVLPFATASAFDMSSPADSLVVDSSGKVGVGTSTPSARLHVKAGNAQLNVENTNAVAAKRFQLALNNNGPAGFSFKDNSNGSEWQFVQTSTGGFTASKTGSGGPEINVTHTGRIMMGPGADINFDLRDNGDLYIPNGSVYVGGAELSVPDYVFKSDYKLMPLDELKGFISKKKHLPNVPSEKDIQSAKLLNVGEMQMTHLEKIEELTLYTLQQHEQIKVQNRENDEQNTSLQKLAASNDLLEKNNEQLQNRLAALEKLVISFSDAGKLGKHGLVSK